MWLTRHAQRSGQGIAQRSGQGIEPTDVLVGHLPPCLGEGSVLENVHVVIVIEEDHGPDRRSHSSEYGAPRDSGGITTSSHEAVLEPAGCASDVQGCDDVVGAPCEGDPGGWPWCLPRSSFQPCAPHGPVGTGTSDAASRPQRFITGTKHRPVSAEIGVTEPLDGRRHGRLVRQRAQGVQVVGGGRRLSGTRRDDPGPGRRRGRRPSPWTGGAGGTGGNGRRSRPPPLRCTGPRALFASGGPRGTPLLHRWDFAAATPRPPGGVGRDEGGAGGRLARVRCHTGRRTGDGAAGGREGRRCPRGGRHQGRRRRFRRTDRGDGDASADAEGGGQKGDVGEWVAHASRVAVRQAVPGQPRG